MCLWLRIQEDHLNMGKKKGGRGGGRRHYVTSEEDLDNRTKQQEAFAAQRAVRRADADGEEGEEGEKEAGFAFEKMRAAVEVVQEEEEEEDESPKTRKPKGVQGLIDIANPNAAKPQQKSMKAKDMKDDVKVQHLSDCASHVVPRVQEGCALTCPKRAG